MSGNLVFNVNPRLAAEAIDEFLHLAKSSDADRCSAQHMVLMYQLRDQFVAIAAKDTLDSMCAGGDALSSNFCSSDGVLYPDVLKNVSFLAGIVGRNRNG
jgi:hypothetical protein